MDAPKIRQRPADQATGIRHREHRPRFEDRYDRVIGIAGASWHNSDWMRNQSALWSTGSVLPVLLLTAGFATQLRAQTPVPPAGSTAPTQETRWFVRNWTRVESWRFFDPNAGGGDPDYTDIANRLQVGVEHRSPRDDVIGAIQFANRYPDTRAVRARPDNTNMPATAADVHIDTFGSSVAGAYPRNAGHIDVVGWIAGHTGTWYAQTQRAHAAAAELGFQWSNVAARPWLRAGFFRASGDADPADTRHGAFFPVMPT